MIPFKCKAAFALVLFTFLFLETKAQSDFRPGYVITLQADTVHGFINYRSDVAHAKNCVFKKEQDQDRVVYTPDQIQAYRFTEGKYYRASHTFKYKFEKETFVEAASQGVISVFYYKDDVKTHYFVLKDSLLVELDHHDRFAGTMKVNDVNQDKAVPEKFRGQLTYLMWDQPSLFPKIERTSCTTKSLVALAQEYQALRAPSQAYIQFEKGPSKGVKAGFGVYWAGGMSHIDSPPYNMYRSDYDVKKFLDFKTSFTYEVGALIDMSLNFIGENKYFLQLAPALNFSEYKSQQELSLAPLNYSYKTNIRYTALKLPLTFKYSFYRSNAAVLPFLAFGPACDIYLQQKGNFEYKSAPINGTASQEKVYTESLGNTFDHKPVLFSFVGGAGIDIKTGKTPVSLGMMYKTGQSPLDGTRADLQFQMGLLF